MMLMQCSDRTKSMIYLIVSPTYLLPVKSDVLITDMRSENYKRILTFVSYTVKWFKKSNKCLKKNIFRKIRLSLT